MGKRWFLSISTLTLFVLLAACTLGPDAPVQETPAFTVTAVAEVPATTTTVPTLVPTVTATATALPLPSATATAVPPATATAGSEEGDLSLHADDVFIYPVPRLYSGDSVTFRVLPHVPEQVSPADVTVRIKVEDRISLEGTLSSQSLTGEPAGLFSWAWETQGEVGNYQVTITLDPEDRITNGDANPENNEVTLTVPVLPATSRPAREREAAWITTNSACCTIHVVSGTAAHRDLNQLKPMVDRAVQQAAERLGEQPQEEINLYFVDRVIGQGGYAGSSMVISYLDRNYVGNGVYEVLVHETVHLLDRQFAPNRIPFLTEGLAVWATGGHYKQENIDQRLVALRQTDLYIPLRELVNNFYEHQHEIGYLQAAGFISFLIDTYGWDYVRAFYSDVSVAEGDVPAIALDATLQAHFGRTLSEVEIAWMRYLDTLTPDPAVRADVLATVRYYNVMRSYQLLYDPTAHFLQAWLPFPQELEQRQLTAEMIRHPDDEINVTLEVMLYAVDQAIRAGNYRGANVILDSVERALANDGLFQDPLGVQYQKIVQKLSGLGFEVHQIDMSGNRATVQATEGRRIYLTPLSMLLHGEAWVLLN